MGYYIELIDHDFVLLAENGEAALAAVHELNQHDELKHGGSWSGGNQTEKCFSWMPADYDKTTTSVAEVLELLGFDPTVNEAGDIVDLGYYDSKSGQEDLFIKALAPFVEKGAYLVWQGEDGAVWREDITNGAVTTRQGRVVFD